MSFVVYDTGEGFAAAATVENKEGLHPHDVAVGLGMVMKTVKETFTQCAKRMSPHDHAMFSLTFALSMADKEGDRGYCEVRLKEPGDNNESESQSEPLRPN